MGVYQSTLECSDVGETVIINILISIAHFSGHHVTFKDSPWNNVISHLGLLLPSPYGRSYKISSIKSGEALHIPV